MACCSFCKADSSNSFSVFFNHFAFAGLSFTKLRQQKAHNIAGKPSQINIHLQPTEWIKYPDKMDIQSIVAGLPRIRKVLARERSALVNHLLNKISIEGNTALYAYFIEQ